MSTECSPLETMLGIFSSLQRWRKQLKQKLVYHSPGIKHFFLPELSVLYCFQSSTIKLIIAYLSLKINAPVTIWIFPCSNCKTVRLTSPWIQRWSTVLSFQTPERSLSTYISQKYDPTTNCSPQHELLDVFFRTTHRSSCIAHRKAFVISIVLFRPPTSEMLKQFSVQCNCQEPLVHTLHW